MDDLFLRQRTQSLSGTTIYDQYGYDPETVLDQSVALGGSDVWTDLFTLTDAQYQVFTAYNLWVDADGGDLADVKMRMLAAPTGTPLDSQHKIFPHAAEGEVLSNVTQHLKLGIKLQEHVDFSLQVKGIYTSGSPSLTLGFLSVIFNPALNY